MDYLVDANVLSEATRPQPNVKVIDWLMTNERFLAVDPVIVGELRYGILLLPKGKRRTRLESWFSEGIEKLLCFDWTRETGLRWAQMLADLKSRGQAMPIKDSMIAATAATRSLTVVTRNITDFSRANVDVLNPFD
jgi:predicted nucleic acid-binding protein